MIPQSQTKARNEATLRRIVLDMPRQKIGEVSRLGMGKPETIPLWYGEFGHPDASLHLRRRRRRPA